MIPLIAIWPKNSIQSQKVECKYAVSQMQQHMGFNHVLEGFSKS